MATADSQELKLHLPAGIIERIERIAMERHETPDQVVAEALWFSLHPVRQQALQRLKGSFQKLETQPEAEVRVRMETGLSEAEHQRLSQILETNRTEGLTPEKQAEMQHLFERIEAVATEKAAAIWLLSGKSSTPDAG